MPAQIQPLKHNGDHNEQNEPMEKAATTTQATRTTATHRDQGITKIEAVTTLQWGKS